MTIVKIRLAYSDEHSYLQEIEVLSGAPFATVGMPEIAADDPMSLDDMAECAVWVAVDTDDVPVAFAAVSPVDGVPHVHQISVHPAHARQGIGAALLRSLGRPLTLTTFRDVPWNAPYYARLGFEEITDPEPELAAQMALEASRGLDPALRVAMLLPAQVEA